MRALAAAALVVLAACAHAAPAPEAPSAPGPVPAAAAPRPRPEPPVPVPDWPVLAAREVERVRPELRDCYEQEVRRVEDAAVRGAFKAGAPVPPLEGRLVLVMPVEPDGSVVEPRLDDDTLHNGNVRVCLLAKASGLRFAPPPEPVELTVPFSFQLRGPGGT